MKRLALTIVVAATLPATCFKTQAQYVTIPDPIFATWLANHINFDECMSGNQMDTTCFNIVNCLYLQVNSDISDLTGVQYFDNLLTLNCMFNLLTALPPLPNTLTQLNCSYNQLASLPALPASLNFLECTSNNLTELPALPNSLASLTCSNNQLFALPALPNSLFALACSYNYITTLPDIPGMLMNLGCSNNLLSIIPELPQALTTLYAVNNNLTALTNLPDTIYSVLLDGNPLLSCLPPFVFLSGGEGNFSIDSTNITCLSSVIQHDGYIPAIDTMPICGPGNPNGCEFVVSVNGIEDSILSVYPNPFTDEFQLNVTGITSPTQLFITNALGQRIHQAVFTSSDFDRHQVVDMSAFPVGIYAVTINLRNEYVTHKLIKQ